MLPRPFAITKIGPVNLFVQDLDAALAFYIDSLGFTVTEEGEYRGIGWFSCGMGRSITAWRYFPRCYGRSWGVVRTPPRHLLGSRWGATASCAMP